MKPCTIPFDLPFCEIASVTGTATGIEIGARMVRLPGIRPKCDQLSDEIHGYYERMRLDLPIAQLSVRIKLRVRRYRCRTSSCAQQTFNQRLRGFVEPYERLTNRLLTSLYHIAQATSGQAAAGFPGVGLARQRGLPRGFTADLNGGVEFIQKDGRRTVVSVRDPQR